MEKSEKILEIKNVCKKIRKKEILKNVSMNINKGEILGLIGPNGAGKTTLIKLSLGLQSITSGEIYIEGHDISKEFEKAMKNVSAIVENPDEYMYLTGRKNLILNARLYPDIPRERIDEVVKLVGLTNVIDKKVSTYSLGMRQRLGLAEALYNKPELLILDEPTNGLDPAGMKELRILLKKISKESGTSILISSHNLHEIENLCDSICILQNGVVIEQNKVEAFRDSLITNKYTITFDVINEELKAKIVSILSSHLSEKSINKIDYISNNQIEILVDKEVIPEVAKDLLNNGIKIYEMISEKASLEDAFIGKTGGNVID